MVVQAYTQATAPMFKQVNPHPSSVVDCGKPVSQIEYHPRINSQPRTENPMTHGTPKKDALFSQPQTTVAGFVFDQNVVDVFPDMIKRSVPGYGTILHMIGQLTQRYAQADSRCYDFGCSLGAATLAMRHRIRAANVKIISIDNSEAMLERCQQVIDADSTDVPVELLKADIQDVPIVKASVCVLNFTLQFIPLIRQRRIIA